MSLGVVYCVPEIHCKFEIVGRGGIMASGLKSLSRDRVLNAKLGNLAPAGQNKLTDHLLHPTR